MSERPRTIVESPQARLRRELGLPEIGCGRVCAGDWMGLNVGDKVREKGGRHVGRLEAIHNSATVRVRWPNGWSSIVQMGDIERAGSNE